MRFAAVLFLVALLGLILFDAAFVVSQKDQVIITRFGEPVGEPIREPGLNFKLPLIDKLHVFDKRFLAWDGRVTEVQTKEKLLIIVDTYARWRIADPLGFFQRLQNVRRALGRIDAILNGATRDVVARYNLDELVQTTTAEERAARAAADEEEAEAALEPEEVTELQPIRYGRAAIRAEILKSAKAELELLGIELLDVQFKRINYTDQVLKTVYDRMRAERKRIASRFRSEGEGEASRIRGEMERELKEIQSGAYRTAQEIVGRADAEAIDVYARAYGQSAEARAFFEFLKTMETYRDTFDEDTWLMLSTDGDFYRFLQSSGGR
ncbi:MAG: protease modulator HflC [Acidobacteria bacterium]|nr:MAG: protease modulator HflC [Acidobacteriota bacterium]